MNYRVSRHLVNSYLDQMVVETILSPFDDIPTWLAKMDKAMDRFEEMGYDITEYKEIWEELEDEYEGVHFLNEVEMIH